MPSNHFQLPSTAAFAVTDHRLIDVRKPAARSASGRRLNGALWVDPYALGHGHPCLATNDPLLFCCVHGHEVSQFATALALMHGCTAAYVRGGFEALVAAGYPTSPLAEEPMT